MAAKIHQAVVIGITWLLLAGALGAEEPDFSRLLDRYKQSGSAILYTECSMEEGGKALLILNVPPKSNLWFHTVQSGWLTGGAQMVLTGSDFRFIDPPGGHGTRARIRRYIEGLLKEPWTFLTPSEIPTLRTSVPSAKCRTLGFDEG
jgi:hypothetical protein